MACSGLISFIVCSADPELMSEDSKKVDKIVCARFLQKISEHENYRLEAAIGNRRFFPQRTSGGIEPLLSGLIM